MKVQLPCTQCGKRTMAVADVRDDGTCDVECKSGHRLVAVVQNPRFELLIDSATLALSDDYYREAVASFAASLDAFWGLYVRVTARRLGSSSDDVERLRRDLRLSERLRGAMQLAHLLLMRERFDPGDNKKALDLGDRTRTEFRNEVVHAGLFPTRSEAVAYGRWVYESVGAGVVQLRAHAMDDLQNEVTLEVGRARAALQERGVTGNIMTFFAGSALSVLSEARRPFDDVLRFWADWNVWELARRQERHERDAEDDA